MHRVVLVKHLVVALFAGGTAARACPLINAPVVQRFIVSIFQLSAADGTDSLLIRTGVFDLQAAAMDVIHQCSRFQAGKPLAYIHDFTKLAFSKESSKAQLTAGDQFRGLLGLDHAPSILEQQLQCSQNRTIL